MKRRALVYLRVRVADPRPSYVARKTEELINAQLTACLDRIMTLGAQMVDFYADIGESANNMQRDGLRRLMRHLAGDRDIDYVVVTSLDRLARNRLNMVEIDLAIRAAGAELVSADGTDTQGAPDVGELLSHIQRRAS